MSLVAYDADSNDSDSTESDDDSAAVVPACKRAKARGPVKIMLPELSPSSSSSDDDDGGQRKRVRLTSGKATTSGLLSVLPPPKQQLEASSSRPRLMLPSTLSRSKVAQKNKAPNVECNGEEASFSKAATHITTAPTLPLLENKEAESTSTYFAGEQLHPAQMYNLINSDDGAYNHTAATSSAEMPPDLAKILKRDKLARWEYELTLQEVGPEGIQVKDAKADDALGADIKQQLVRNLSTQRIEMELRADLKKGPQPTSRQKRKHQLSYLAHVAKEKEVELQQTWAQNRMSRRQTQAKYGFI